jgi:hypothetical protein
VIRRAWSIRALAGVAVLTTGLVVIGGPVAAEPLPNPGPPQDAADARGTTFIGTVERHFTRDVQGHELAFVRFRIENVLARDHLAVGQYRPRVGHDYDVYTSMGFAVDGLVDRARYLFSSSQIRSPQSGDTAAWRIHDNGRVTFVEMSSFRRSGDPRLRSTTTVAGAVELMVPSLPATEVGQPRQGFAQGAQRVVLGAVSVATFVFVFRRRRSWGNVQGRRRLRAACVGSPSQSGTTSGGPPRSPRPHSRAPQAQGRGEASEP